MLAACLHNLNPVILHITGAWAVRWYGIAYLTGFAVGWWLLRWCSKRGLTRLTLLQVGDLVMFAVAGVVLGGRLGYVLFYQPSLVWTFSDTVPWWGVLMIQKGGMSSHGGMIGVILAGAWWYRRLGQEQSGENTPRVGVLHVLDLLALACTPGLMFGRLANFVNGELLGRIVALPGQPAPWWAVKYPQELMSGHDPAAEKLLTPEAAAQREQSLRSLLDQVVRPGDDREQAIQRLIERVQHGSRELTAQLDPLISARHPSQLYQAAAEGLVLFLVLFFIWRRPRKPGVIGAWFLIAYGVMRVLTEFVRLEDVGDPLILGLHRGQWLSVAMVAVGAIGLALVVRRPVPKLGGWGVA